MDTKRLFRDILVATAAGYAGTKALEQLGMKTYQWESKDDRAREDEARPGPPFVLAVDNLATWVLGLELNEATRAKAGMALHYLAGVAWAPVYMWLRRSTDLNPLAAGLATGLSQSLVLDEAITPAIGASAPNPAYPLVTHLRGLVGHAGYGLAVAATVETTWLLTSRRA